MIINVAHTSTLFFLLQPSSSILNITRFSNTAIIVDNAANVRNKKNKNAQILPPLICAKIFGNVIKIRLGPAPGSIPYEKHAGMIINPAVRATNVSRSIIFTASPVRLLD